MKKLLPLLICTFIFSCKSKEQKLRDEINPILSKLILQDSSVFKIDSLKIYRIDTLSDLKIAERRIENISEEATYYTSIYKSYISQTQLNQEQAQLSASQAKLYLSVLDSKELGSSEIENAKRYLKESEELTKKAEIFRDSAVSALKTVTEIRKQIDSKKINSKNFKGYVILYGYKGSDKKNLEIKQDSIISYISPSLRIIPIHKM